MCGKEWCSDILIDFQSQIMVQVAPISDSMVHSSRSVGLINTGEKSDPFNYYCTQ